MYSSTKHAPLEKNTVSKYKTSKKGKKMYEHFEYKNRVYRKLLSYLVSIYTVMIPPPSPVKYSKSRVTHSYPTNASKNIPL